MTPRKPLLPKPQRSLVSEFAYQSYPKSIEKPSVVTWGNRGRGVSGESTNSGDPRPNVIRRQFGTR